ncbi:MAG: hypothetical protein Q7T11_09350, partial [Deltaproteobacteria bacterium]|nr:hypothetical protein [Deltaproteobacteria bacterium]
YAGEIAFDGTNAFIPFREGSDPDAPEDQIVKYAVSGGSISESDSATTGANPFGVALSGGTLLVVNDDELDIFDTDLDLSATVDLTAADDADINDTDSTFVEGVAIDAATNRAFITNRRGKILVVDLDDNTLSHVLSGTSTTRGIASDGTFIYAVEGDPASLLIFDPTQLSDSSSPDEVDDSTLIVSVISLGANPNGLALDAANNRAYVTNTGDHSVSVIDLILGEEIARISLDEDDTEFDDCEDPFGIAVGTFDGVPFVFTANLGTNNIAVINANTLNVVEVFP